MDLMLGFNCYRMYNFSPDLVDFALVGVFNIKRFDAGCFLDKIDDEKSANLKCVFDFDSLPSEMNQPAKDKSNRPTRVAVMLLEEELASLSA